MTVWTHANQLKPSKVAFGIANFGTILQLISLQNPLLLCLPKVPEKQEFDKN